MKHVTQNPKTNDTKTHATMAVSDAKDYVIINATAVVPTFNRICMPLIEWICVAGIPTLLCVKIVGIPPLLLLYRQATVAPDENVGVASSDCVNLRDCHSLTWIMPVLLLTLLLSLVAVVITGDGDASKDDGTHINQHHHLSNHNDCALLVADNGSINNTHGLSDLNDIPIDRKHDTRINFAGNWSTLFIPK